MFTAGLSGAPIMLSKGGLSRGLRLSKHTGAPEAPGKSPHVSGRCQRTDYEILVRHFASGQAHLFHYVQRGNSNRLAVVGR
jgi:hypothetical protein